MGQELLFPSFVAIDTLNTCNARCPFCPLFVGEAQMDRRTQPATIMSQELFEKILGQIASWEKRPGSVAAAANGETLQDPNIELKLKALHRFGLNDITTLLTNAHFLDEKVANAILDAEIADLLIGFDGATKEVYEAHRVRCKYDRVLANITNFVKLRSEKKSKTRVRIKFVRTTANEHEVQAAFEMFSKIMDASLDTFEDSLAMDWGDLPTNYEGYYYFHQGQRGKRLSSCALAEPSMTIHSDGTLSACCWDYNLEVSDGGFGSSKEAAIIDIWHGQKRSDFIQSLAEPATTPKKCGSCIWAHEMDDLPDSLLKLDSGHLYWKGKTSAVYKFPQGA
jgi:pyruvate-formate lyase-activating enzyme